MRRPPFDRLPDLSGVFHTEQYSLLLDHLAVSTIQSDYLVAVCGADGCGKTTLLNRFLFTLGEDVCIARLDESYKGVKEFYCEILRQLGFNDIDGKPEELRRITREFIVNRGMASEPVLVVIDNAHLISPFILEQLRWLAAIKVDEVRVLSCVLAGNSDLVRIMDSTAMSQFAFNNYVRFHIRAFSEAETIDYVRSRLNFAGCSDSLLISEAARPLIHRFSGGIPRLINILCDAVLQEACTLESTEITDEMLRNVAEARHLVPHVLPYTGKGRRRTDPDYDPTRSQPGSKSLSPARDGYDSNEQYPEPSFCMTGKAKEHFSATKESTGLQQQFSRMSKKLAEMKNENSRFSKQIDLRDYDIRELQKTLECQTLQYTELKEAFGNKSGAYKQLRESLSLQLQSLERSKKTNSHLVATLQKKQEELTGLRSKFGEAAGDKDIINSLRHELDKLREKLADSADADSKLTSLQSEMLDLRCQHDSDIEEIARLQSELSDSLEALGYFEHERDLAKLEANELQELADKYERQATQKTVLLSDMEAVVQTHEQEVSFLQSRIDELETDQLAVADQLNHFASLEAYANDCETRLHALQLELENAQQQNALGVADTGLTVAGGPTCTESNDGEPAAGDRTESSRVPIRSRVLIRTIEVFRGDIQEQVLRLNDDQKRIMIGRDNDNELVLDSNFISRHHAIISFREDGSACIEDLNSLNGIVVNKTKRSSSEIIVGDVLIIGDFCLLPGPA